MIGIDKQLETLYSSIYNFANSYLQMIVTVSVGLFALTATLTDPSRHPSGFIWLHASWYFLTGAVVLSLLTYVSYIFGAASQIALVSQGRFYTTLWQRTIFTLCSGAGLVFLAGLYCALRFALQ
jgi:hypothetical protein